MNFTSWNIRGLNGPEKKIVLKNRLAFDKHGILLIQETKLDMDNLTLIQKICFQNYNYITNSPTSMTQGIMTLWKSSQFNLSSYVATTHLITIALNIIGTNENISITNIYTPHRVVEIIKLL